MSAELEQLKAENEVLDSKTSVSTTKSKDCERIGSRPVPKHHVQKKQLEKLRTFHNGT